MTGAEMLDLLTEHFRDHNALQDAISAKVVEMGGVRCRRMEAVAALVEDIRREHERSS